MAERLTPAGRWRDPPSVAPPRDPVELDAETISVLRTTLESGLAAAGSEDFQA
ncbi:MAG: hypothetical protein ACOC26_06300 [Halochromatium sp.]|uniref:hypothetical protein n=1 Tax=Halochromatium sp. TaxID=2049430 RepID=UPI00397C6641